MRQNRDRFGLRESVGSLERDTMETRNERYLCTDEWNDEQYFT